MHIVKKKKKKKRKKKNLYTWGSPLLQAELILQALGELALGQLGELAWGGN